MLAGAVVGVGPLTSACTGSTPESDAHLVVTPGTSRADERLTLQLQGVSSGTPVTVGVTSNDDESVAFTARAAFTVGDAGALTPATSATPSRTAPATTVGTDQSGDPTLLISAMQPPSGSTGQKGSAYVWPVKGGTFTWTVQGSDGQSLATASVQRSLVAAQTRLVALAKDKDGVVGQYAAVTDGARHPAVLVLGGSEGGFGFPTMQAAALAARGIPALAQAYFKAPGLPDALTQIPMETFDKGLEWLRAQPEVDPARIWVIGGSYGPKPRCLRGLGGRTSSTG